MLIEELFVTFDVAGDCVALVTAKSLEELLTLPFVQTSDKLPDLADESQCLVRFNVVPLHVGRGSVLFGEQISVKLTWIWTAVSLACKVAFCKVQFEIVALHEAVELTAVEFCSDKLLLLDVVVFTDDTVTVSSKGAALACETKTVIAANTASANT